MEQEQYKKLKCAFCGYEIATRARIPRCTKCGSRRLNTIEEFSVTKPFRKQEETTMTKKQISSGTPQPAGEPKPQAKDEDSEPDEDDDIDRDLWG